MKKNLNISFIILILYTLALFHCQADEQFADKLKFSSQLSHNVGTVDELYAVLKKVKRGETIIIKNGTYNDVRLATNKKGIYIKAETVGKVHFTGSSRVQISGQNIHFEGVLFIGKRTERIIYLGGKQNRVSRCTFIKCNPEDPKEKFHWVEVDGFENRIDHCLFDGMNHIGVMVIFSLSEEKAGNHLFYRNYLKNRIKGFYRKNIDATNGFETMRIGFSGYSHLEGKVTIEDNLFESCDGEIEAISIKTSSNIIRNNTFRNCAGTVTTRQCMGTEITGNYFLNNDPQKETGGIRIIGPKQKVYRNYFEGLTRRSLIDLYAGNFVFVLGKLYSKGMEKVHRDGKEGYVFPKASSGNYALNYGQVTDADISQNTFIASAVKLRFITANSSYGTKERNLLNERVSVSKNIFYSEFTSNKLIHHSFSDTKAMKEENMPIFEDNILHFSKSRASAVKGTKKRNPRFKRDEYGILRSKLYPDSAPPKPPLSPTDVGPDSE